MDAPQIHLALNHLPVIGVPVGMLLLVGGMLARSAAVERAALVVTLVAGLSAIPVFYSGEDTEEAVEEMEHVSHDLVHEHEEAGETTAIACVVLAALSAVGLGMGMRGGREVPRWAAWGTLVLAAATSGLGAWTAHLGGQAAHPELRPGWEAPAGGEHDEGGGGDAHEEREDRG